MSSPSQQYHQYCQSHTSIEASGVKLIAASANQYVGEPADPTN